MDDFVESLGAGFLAHRLRRASDQILDASGDVLQRHGFEGPARSVSMLLLLRGEGPLAVTAIAQRLRLSHPMVIKLVRALQQAGLAADRVDPHDNRRRLIALTKRGESQAELAETIAQAVAIALGANGSALLDALDTFVGDLRARPLADRIEVALRKPAQSRRRG